MKMLATETNFASYFKVNHSRKVRLPIFRDFQHNGVKIMEILSPELSSLFLLRIKLIS